MKAMKTTLGIAALAAVAAFPWGATAGAAVTNGGFELFPDFVGWSTLGETTVRGAGFGVGPVEGARQAILETVDNPEWEPQPSNHEVEQFLWLPLDSLDALFSIHMDPGELPKVTEGAAIRQAVTAAAGDVLKFKWNFLTEEHQHDPTHTTPDFGFVSLVRTGDGKVILLEKLADVSSPLMTPAPTVDLPPPFYEVDPTGQTGFQDFTFVIPEAGTYLLGFGAMDALDTFVDSALIVDASQIVPEPATAGLLVFGGLAGLLRRVRSADRRKRT